MEENNKNIFLNIIDNGIGISEENKELIFNRFYQVETSRNKDLNKGIGLGLSIVYEIAKIHKIDVYLESEINKGTKFIVKF